MGDNVLQQKHPKKKEKKSPIGVISHLKYVGETAKAIFFFNTRFPLICGDPLWVFLFSIYSIQYFLEILHSHCDYMWGRISEDKLKDLGYHLKKLAF